MIDNTSEQDAPVPVIQYPEELPVSACREELARAIGENPVTIVAGETGSGKTTQLPKICLEMGRGRDKAIGHTQPRRLAARTVADRIAQELHTRLGELVGFKVRFSDKTSDSTSIKLMTDGILLAELQRDRLLQQYDTLIIDEAHERSLNVDFLLGYLKRILPQRPDLRVIITSATLDVASFAQHFGDAPVIEVPGRSYPVETVYREPDDGRDMNQVIAELLEEIERGGLGPRGDTLVFLPGEREIRELSRDLRQASEMEVLPLYARLTQVEQARVFANRGRDSRLRVVLATNVAETSLTVPGIRYVIDPGEVRISRYSHRTRLQRLPLEPVSRASADQRKGRCGRVGPGVCLRLYSEQDYLGRPEFTDPEIKRTNLAAVILQMLALKLGDVAAFPFVDPPDPRLIRDGYKVLQELGAVDCNGKLSTIGRRMARLPVDPRLARMVLTALEQGCLAEILVISSAMAVQDPRERPPDKQQQADLMHARFAHPRSDFMMWPALWRYFEEQRQTLSQNKLRKLCLREYLSYTRMREWRDIHTQLSIACRQLGIKPQAALSETEDYQAIHIAVLSGLLGNIARHDDGRDYLGARNRALRLWPGSGQARKSPKWVVAGEVVETNRIYARTVGAIDPAWVLGINPALLKSHCYEPRWHPRRGQVVAFERITLYGLILVDRRVIHYGPLDAQESRGLMIREGLIPARLRQLPAFLQHNQRMVKELEDMESRTRRRDILVDEHSLYAFYDARLPADICTASSLRTWLKRNPERARALFMTRDDLVARDPGVLSDQYPDHLEWEGTRFSLAYQFEPGKQTDGVTVTVPVALLNRAPRHLFDWLVPGMLREKCIQLVRSLPKDKRKHLVPVPDTVDRALDGLHPENNDLLAALAVRLSKIGGIKLEQQDFARTALDDYYRMNIRVVDARGKLLDQGRDLGLLVNQFQSDTRQSVSADHRNSPARDNITRWDFDELPRKWRFRQAGVDIEAYPALVVRGESVAIELCDYPGEALRLHRGGVLWLTRREAVQQVRLLRKNLLRGNDCNLALAAAGFQRGQLVEDLIDAAYLQTMELDDTLPWSADAFQSMVRQGREKVVAQANDIEATLLNVLAPLAAVQRSLLALDGSRWDSIRADIDGQLAGLLGEGFLRDTPGDWLAQFPRYVKAVRTRLERLSGQTSKDMQHTRLLEQLTQPLLELLRERPRLIVESPEVIAYRWMLEEFRVSLFAQSLGTRHAVSEKRLRQRWQAVDDWVTKNPH